MFKPLFLEKGRALLKVNKIIQRPIAGEEMPYDLEKTATVQSCTLPELKKGTVVVPIIRGGVPIAKEETKKFILISLDVEDIYAQEV